MNIVIVITINLTKDLSHVSPEHIRGPRFSSFSSWLFHCCHWEHLMNIILTENLGYSNSHFLWVACRPIPILVVTCDIYRVGSIQHLSLLFLGSPVPILMRVPSTRRTHLHRGFHKWWMELGFHRMDTDDLCRRIAWPIPIVVLFLLLEIECGHVPSPICVSFIIIIIIAVVVMDWKIIIFLLFQVGQGRKWRLDECSNVGSSQERADSLVHVGSHGKMFRFWFGWRDNVFVREWFCFVLWNDGVSISEAFFYNDIFIKWLPVPISLLRCDIQNTATYADPMWPL